MKEPNEEESNWEYDGAADQSLKGSQRLKSELREVGLINAIFHGVARFFTRILMRILIRLRVEGYENLPEDSPFVVVANHTSHLDALLIANVFPSRFIGKYFSLAAEDFFFDTPSKSVFATQWVNALPLRRGRTAGKALGNLRTRLENGNCIFIVFPEGTRSRNGEMNRFKPGIGMLVAGTDVPVIPCHLFGAFETWPPEKKLPGFGKITLKIGEPIRFKTQPNEKSGWTAISAELEAAVRKLA